MIPFAGYVLFESLPLLLLAEAAGLAAALAVHRRRRSAGTRIGLAAVLVLCILLPVLQHLVETDAEQIRRLISTAAAAVDAGDTAALADALHERFTDGVRDKAAFVQSADLYLQRVRIDELRVGGFDVRVNGDAATVAFIAVCDWHGGSRSEHGVRSRWTVVCERTPAGWKMRRIESGRVGPAGMLDWRQAGEF